MFSEKKFCYFKKGTTILSENDPVTDIDFVLSGKVGIQKNSEEGIKTLYYLQAGDLMGIDHALTESNYYNSAYAEEDTSTLSIRKEIFLEALNSCKELRLWVLKYLSCKLDSICE